MVDRELAFEDFEYFASTCLSVQELESLRVVPLVLKPVQLRLARAIVLDLAEGKPARYIVLKARREGVSTVVQAIFFWLAATRRHQQAMTISHHDDTTKALFRMSERFYRHMPSVMRPMRRMSRAGEVLEFANPKNDAAVVSRNPGLESVLRTVTFKNAGAGQGANLLHCSEVGLWGNEADNTLSTLLPIVPYAPWTIIILESTARGVGGTFHEQWQKAVNGESQFTPFFIPWHEEPFYSMTPHQDLGDLDDEEVILRESGVRDDQLAWRRWIGVPGQTNLDKFHQEYPSTPDEAFLSTGRPFFDQHVLRQRLNDVVDEPIFQGDVHEEDLRVVAKKRPKGPLRIWERPDPDEDYLLVCDPSEGIAHGDPQSIYITPRSRLEIVAAWHGHVPREDLGDVVFRLGHLYQNALVAVEMNGGWGHTPIAILRRRGYRRLYQRRPEGKKKRKASDTLGWDTTNTLRAMALDKLDEALRTGDLKVNDRELLDECMHFIYSETGKPQADKNHHDDRVISASILCHLWQTTPKRRKFIQDDDDQDFGLTGYGS